MGRPAGGILVNQRMHDVLGYLQRIHEAVITAGAGTNSPDPMGVCGVWQQL